jgi:hypothetical protein
MHLINSIGISILIFLLSACGNEKADKIHATAPEVTAPEITVYDPPITIFQETVVNTVEKLEPLIVLSKEELINGTTKQTTYHLSNGSEISSKGNVLWLDKDKKYSFSASDFRKGLHLKKVYKYEYGDDEFYSSYELEQVITPPKKEVIYKDKFEKTSEFNERKRQQKIKFDKKLKLWKESNEPVFLAFELSIVPKHSGIDYITPEYDADNEQWVHPVRSLSGPETFEQDPQGSMNDYILRGDKFMFECNGECKAVKFPQARDKAKSLGWNKLNRVVVVVSSISKKNQKNIHDIGGKITTIDKTNNWTGKVMLVSGIQNNNGIDNVFISYKNNTFTEDKFDIFVKEYAYYQNGTFQLKDNDTSISKVIRHIKSLN